MIRKSKSFIDEGFLLDSTFALELYVNYAANRPIIDYHCHLSPTQISNDYQFKNITEIWIEGDHYKWRAMRTLGVDERFITGDASPKENFLLGLLASQNLFVIHSTIGHISNLKDTLVLMNYSTLTMQHLFMNKLVPYLNKQIIVV